MGSEEAGAEEGKHGNNCLDITRLVYVRINTGLEPDLLDIMIARTHT